MQTLIVLAIILAAAAYLGRKFYRTARSATAKGEGCGDACGCADTAVPAKAVTRAESR